MKLNNKYNVNDRVFVFSKGKIIHARVSYIAVTINSSGADIRYHLEGDSSNADNFLKSNYTENELCDKLEDIINHIEVL